MLSINIHLASSWAAITMPDPIAQLFNDAELDAKTPTGSSRSILSADATGKLYVCVFSNALARHAQVPVLQRWWTQGCRRASMAAQRKVGTGRCRATTSALSYLNASQHLFEASQHL